IASVISLTSIIGPPIMTGVFGAFADAKGLYFPGAPFLLAAILLFLAWLALIVTMLRHGGEAAAV
ncbi:MAG: hypothetical protein B7Z43_07315, partial [Sphingomonas sp. 12-62-6]